MPTHVRFVHKTLLDGRIHVYTSPDVQGLHASDETLAGARDMALAMLAYLARREGAPCPSHEFAEDGRALVAA